MMNHTGPVVARSRTVRIVGAHAVLQHRHAGSPPKTTEQVNAFAEYLAKKAINAELLAEQWNADYSTLNHVEQSTVEIVAEHIRIPYLGADPTFEEFAAMGIKPDENAPAEDRGRRIRHWVERLLNSGCRTTVFVCGDDHVDEFAEMLRAREIQVEVISRGWGVELANDLERSST